MYIVIVIVIPTNLPLKEKQQPTNHPHIGKYPIHHMDPMGFKESVHPKNPRRIVCQAMAACVGLMAWSEPPGEKT